MRIAHFTTVISCQFAVIDDDDNAIPQQPFQVTLDRFNRDAFTDAYDQLVAARDAAKTEGEAQEALTAATVPEPAPRPNRAARRAKPPARKPRAPKR